MDRDTLIYWFIGLFCTATIALVCWASYLDYDVVIGVTSLFLLLWALMSLNKVQGILDFKRRKDNQHLAKEGDPCKKKNANTPKKN